MSEVWINDVDLADYGFVLGADPKHTSSPDFSDASGALLGAIGPLWLGEPVQGAARALAITGHLVASSAAQLRQSVDALKLLSATGAVRIRFADRPDQEFRDARLTSAAASSRVAILSNLAADLTLAFQLADPLRYDVNPQGVGLSTARASLPIGTAPSAPTILVHGGGASLTNPTLTYRNAGGDVVQTMSLAGTLGAADYLVIDCLRCQVTKVVSGVASDALAWWASGDFLVVRAADGWSELAEYPTLELSAYAGVPVGQITYPRCWL